MAVPQGTVESKYMISMIDVLTMQQAVHMFQALLWSLDEC